MGLIGNFIVQIFSNAVAILAAGHFVVGFSWGGTFPELILAATILALINKIFKPVAKLFFGPLILITFGLFLIVINAATLYILDLLIEPLKIQGIIPLFLGTLIVGSINFLTHAGKMRKEQ